MIQTNTNRSRLSVLALLTLAFVMAAPNGEALAQNKVQRPKIHTKAKNRERAKAITAARRQNVPPAAQRAMATKLTALAKQAGTQKLLTNASFREAIAKAPMHARLEVFKAMVKAGKGKPVQNFERRLRGMLKAGKKNNVVSAKKTFFEVTPETLDLFQHTMGQNAIWFAASPSPGHLHTLLADQGGGEVFTHNTYGYDMNTASITNNYVATQYAAPVLLTDKQMDRFVRYLNAGVEGGSTGKAKVYGFKKGDKTWVCDTRCTNWATSAPVGEKARWIATTDRRVMKAAKDGRLPPEFKDGLHAALAKAPDKAARDALVAKVTKEAVGKWTKSSAKRLGKEFNVILEKFPKRPTDLIGRDSLSQTLGLNRSQDPAKWMYDLFMSKQVPAIAVLSKTRSADFKAMEFDLEIMGKIDGKGNVVAGGDSLGVIPEGRSPRAPAAAAAAAGEGAQ